MRTLSEDRSRVVLRALSEKLRNLQEDAAIAPAPARFSPSPFPGEAKGETPKVPLGEAATVRAARRLNRAAGMIAASVLADSAMEHYHGEFHNRAMWTPILTAALSMAASVHGHTDRRTGAHDARDLVYVAAGLLRGADRRPGGPVAVGSHGLPVRTSQGEPARNIAHGRGLSRWPGGRGLNWRLVARNGERVSWASMNGLGGKAGSSGPQTGQQVPLPVCPAPQLSPETINSRL